MAFKPIDPKRDEFRRYLERAGVIEALTKLFVRVIKERPEDPMEYLRKNLGDSLQETDNFVYLRNELDEAHAEIQRLRLLIQKVSPEAFAELDHEKQSSQKDAEKSSGTGNHLNTHNAITEDLPDEEIENNKQIFTDPTKTNKENTESNPIPSRHVSTTIDNKD